MANRRIVCGQCGAQNTAKSQYCHSCGQALQKDQSADQSLDNSVEQNYAIDRSQSGSSPPLGYSTPGSSIQVSYNYRKAKTYDFVDESGKLIASTTINIWWIPFLIYIGVFLVIFREINLSIWSKRILTGSR